MEFLSRIDWNILKTYVDNNLIIANKHPEYDIWILNYSPKVQAKKFWDSYTLSCRGLVVDINGNIIARPFQKFKNYEEHDPSEIDMNQPYEIFDKMDGSLIVLFYYKERMEWIIASRGSFISEQAIEAQKMVNGKTLNSLNIDYTFLFEIIFPNNRIIVDYGNLYDLILLAVIETKSGSELSHTEMLNQYSNYFTIVKKYEINNLKNLGELKKLEENNKEGFVVKFKNGFRVKIKFNEYVRLHGILFNVSDTLVWEHLKNGYNFDALFDTMPDEFYDWLTNTINDFIIKFNNVERESLKEFMRIYHINNITNRKEFALEALKSPYREILFRIYDKKSYDGNIWKMIQPKRSTLFRKNTIINNNNYNNEST